MRGSIEEAPGETAVVGIVVLRPLLTDGRGCLHHLERSKFALRDIQRTYLFGVSIISSARCAHAVAWALAVISGIRWGPWCSGGVVFRDDWLNVIEFRYKVVSLRSALFVVHARLAPHPDCCSLF